MQKLLILVACVLISGLVASASSMANAASSQSRVVSVLGVGQVQGRDVLVHISILANANADANDQAIAALQEHGARPFQRSDYDLLGPKWSTASSSASDEVTQHYNPANQPVASASEMEAAQQVWNNAGSAFSFGWGGEANRCGSLIKECPGPQVYDQYQDIGWLDLGRCSIFRCTLAVTWWGDGDGDGFLDDADVAFNTRISPWVANCTNDISIQTVAIHEFGHVLGLGHTDAQGAIMYPSYSAAMCSLHSDDVDGLRALYPTGGAPPTLTSIEVSPAGASIDVGQPQQFQATASYSDGPSTDVTAAAIWSSSNPSVATIDTGGLATGLGAGDTTITATYSGETDSTTLTVASSEPPQPGDIPTVSSCSPGDASPNTQLVVSVDGKGLVAGATVDFGDRIMIQSVSFIDSTRLDVTIKVHPRASSGRRSVTVTNPDGQSSTLPGCFVVN